MAVSEERIQQLETMLRSLQNQTPDTAAAAAGGGGGQTGGGGAAVVSGDGDGSSPGQGASAAQAERLLTLARVTLRAGPGDLLAIVGQVGSGKSSVLAALLGEMRLCYGQVM